MNQRLVCCLLNVSEGRSFKILEDIALAATTVPRSAVLNIFADHEYNRSVLTIAADGSTLVTSVLAAAKKAFKWISLRGHVGGHPRLGAVDLVPFYPLGDDVSLEYCGEKAKELAHRLTAEVEGSSVFFFGFADPDRRGLVERRKQLHWFSNELKATPDLGEFSELRGITGVGATHYVTNFNITLDTQNLGIGQEIAEKLRATSPGGIPGVESMAFLHEGAVEVALNVRGQPRSAFREVEEEPLAGFGEAFYAGPDFLERRVRALAKERGTSIFGRRTVGFWPQEAAALAKEAILVEPHTWRKRWDDRQM